MSKDDERTRRLAQALRDNLRRRKGQAREANAAPGVNSDASIRAADRPTD